MTVRIVSVLEKQGKIQREQQVTPTSMAVYWGWGGEQLGEKNLTLGLQLGAPSPRCLHETR